MASTKSTAVTKAANDAPSTETTGTDVALQNAGGSNIVVFPDSDGLDFFGDAGVGAENIGRNDIALPFFSILQDLSPQTKKTKAEYVEGAKPAMFFNSVTKALIDGESGALFIPGLYAKTFIEWVPNQGGFVKDHGNLTEQQLDRMGAKRGEKGGLSLTNGNDLVETAYHFGLVANGTFDADGNFTGDGTGVEVLYTAKSSGLKVSRRWNSLATGIKLVHPVTKAPFTPALAYMSYRLTTKEVSNDEGTWYALDVAPYKPTVQLNAGKALYMQAVAFAKLMNDKPLPIDVGVADVATDGQTIEGDVNAAF